jgi:acetyl esterase/lipase
MPSFKSRFFIFMLRNRNLFKFQLKRKPEITWDTSIPDLRRKTEKAGMLFGKLPAHIRIEPVTIEAQYAEWVTPGDASKDRVILYFHGGGYVIGSPQGHRTHVAKVVNGSGIPALVFDYRLAPEHPFPAALEDALSAYRWLLDQQIKPEHIVFMGDSAGGGLCLATLLGAREKGLPLPAAAVALSPWTDLTCSSESLTSNEAVDCLTWRESWTIFSKYYVADQNPANPLISPLFGDLKGLPPMLIFVGNDEVLRDDATRFADKAKAAGVDVTLRVGEGMFHCYPVCAPMFPEATEAMLEITEYIKNRLTK